MHSNTKTAPSIKSLLSSNIKYLPALTALVIFILAYTVGTIIYGNKGFLTLRTIFSIFQDNAYLGISAIGMTFVIISGGIDLSVGAIAALTTMIIAHGTEAMGISSVVCVILALFIGTLMGFLMGVLIQVFTVPPFIATLAGMFMARGLCFVISIQSITINDPLFRSLGLWKIQVPDVLASRPGVMAPVGIGVFIFFVVLVLGIVLLQHTKFGRNVYAIGGGEQSAKLMGLPVEKTRIAIYTLNGFCSALSGLTFALSLLSGYGRHLMGMEMDTISSVVIGGTFLSGGVGYPIGSLFGVMIQGIILKFISFNGTLSSWWGKIVSGVLLFLFIVFQRIVVSTANRNK